MSYLKKLLVMINVKHHSIEKLAGCALLAAEGASYEIQRPIITLPDVLELILVGGLQGVSEIYSLGNGEIARGAIAYLRSAVFATGVAVGVSGDDQFGVFRSASLFDFGKTDSFVFALSLNYDN